MLTQCVRMAAESVRKRTALKTSTDVPSVRFRTYLPNVIVLPSVQAIVKPDENLLLARVAPSTLEQLVSPHAVVSLHLRETLVEFDQTADSIYFVTSGVVSVVHVTEEGSMIEVGVVGREGFVSVSSFLGAARQPHRIVVQGNGTAIRVPITRVRESSRQDLELQSAMLTFVHCFLLQVSQTAVCNRLHSIEQRLARWLLMIDDRSDRADLNVTQEFLAYMLGARRAGINEAIQALRSDGLIEAARNLIRLSDRWRLQRRSCECYAAVRAGYDAALGAVAIG